MIDFGTLTRRIPITRNERTGVAAPSRSRPARARSPLRRLSVRLRHSRSNTSTKYSLPGAFTGVSQEAITKRCKVKAERGNGRRTRAGPMSCNRTLSALHRYLGSTHKSTDRLGTQASVLTLYQTTLESQTVLTRSRVTQSSCRALIRASKWGLLDTAAAPWC